MSHRGPGSAPESEACLKTEGHSTAGAIQIKVACGATRYHGVIFVRLLLRAMSGFVTL